MLHNFSIHGDCTPEEALIIAEGILKDMRKKARRKGSSFSLGPLDPTQTHGGKRHKKDEDED